MKLFAVQAVALFLLGLSMTSLADHVFEVDLRTGSASSSLPEGFTWESTSTANNESYTCDGQAVLKLSFSETTRRRAEINMTFEGSQGWTFNVGDSTTNNGYGGDGGTQDYDAEVHSVNNKIYFYGRDNPSGGSYGLLHSQANFVGVQPYTTVTLNVKDELATADNGYQFLYINSYKLFGLNGQNDSSVGGTNRDVYLGMNRVVSSNFRSGRGLCKVRVKFYSS